MCYPICSLRWEVGTGTNIITILHMRNRGLGGGGNNFPKVTSGAPLVAQLVKSLPTMQEAWVWSLGWEDPLEMGQATHSSILAWRISWTVQSMGFQRVRHDWVTFTFKVTSRWPSWKLKLCFPFITKAGALIQEARGFRHQAPKMTEQK